MVAEWPPFGRELLIWFTACFLCIMTYCNSFISQFGFDGGTLVLIVSVPGLCLSFTLDALCALAAIYVKVIKLFHDYGRNT